MEHDAGAADLAEGAMRTMELDGTKVLLARSGGRCHAVGATCPHAGGPLDEGVIHEGAVLCPWHKAALPPRGRTLPRTPGRRRPPAPYPARTRRPAAPHPRRPGPPAAPRPDLRCFAILGSGAAGTAAAQALREAGFGGRVVLAGAEDRLPYDRTVLSKYALSGKQGGEKTPLHEAGFYASHAIERRVGEVTDVDCGTRRLTFADGTVLQPDALLLATGGVPRQLEVPGADLPGVFTLRSPADAEAIVAAAGPGRRAVVAGSGFIGMEAAAALRERGLDVTVVAPQKIPFEDKLGPAVGAVFRRVHEREGVRFRLEDEVAAIEGGDRVRAVRLRGGDTLPADLVVVGLGVVPASGMLHGVPLRKDGGIDVDAHLCAGPGLFAAGDLAAFPLRGDGKRIRVEHWRVAQQHGRIAALNMLGQPTAYGAVPYFWTIHFLKRLDYVGHAASWDEAVIDGDLEKPEFTAFYVKDGRVAAVAGWGRDQAMARAIGLMTDRRDWTVDALRAALSSTA